MRIFRAALFLGVAWCIAAGVARAQAVGCSSDDGHRHYCKAETRNGVTLANQTSSAACQEGYSWGYDSGGIWVDHGCRAHFTLQGSGGKTLYCASDDGHKHYCDVDTRSGVTLLRQRSGAACQEGHSWGSDGRGIWVDRGCRADFAVQTRASNESNAGGHAVVNCSSDDWARHYCQADTSGDVELLKQRSEAGCLQGSSWGFDPNGIWVDRGCRAEFLVEPDERPEYGAPAGGGTGLSLYCASDDGRKNSCEAETRGGAQLVKQRSGAACQEGYSWGYDEHGIWVDHGCRADFVAYSGRDREDWERHGRACRRALGEDRARELVEQCRQVSPGTHPPCNADNSCHMITEEIRRSCLSLGADAPGYCDSYR